MENLKKSARIFIVDDHEIVREGIRTLIMRSRPDWDICGEASDGQQAIQSVRTLKPDVVVLDITMPKMNGLEAASEIAKLGLGVRLLLFTMHESERLSGDVRQSGAQGFVLKSQAARDLIRAIDELLAGGTFFGSEDPAKSEAKPALGKPPSTDSHFQTKPYANPTGDDRGDPTRWDLIRGPCFSFA